MGTITTFPPAPLGYTPANTLAYAQITANQGTITTEVDIAGLTVTVVVSEGRRLRITGYADVYSTVTDDIGVLRIYQDGVTVQRGLSPKMLANNGTPISVTAVVSPTAGVHTYKLTAQRITGTGTMSLEAGALLPAFILVEDITGQSTAVAPASVPVGQLAYAPITATWTLGVTGTATLVPGLSVNVVVPAGRTLRISAMVHARSSVATDAVYVGVQQDGVSLGFAYINESSTGESGSAPFVHIVSPSAGAHTYAMLVQRQGGTGSISVYADSVSPSWILVEDITPTPAPANTAPSSTLAFIENLSQPTTTSVVASTLTATVTVAAGRRLRISSKFHQGTNVANDRCVLQIREGATVLNSDYHTLPNANQGEDFNVSTVVSPSAGAHTYTIWYGRDAGTGTVSPYNNTGVDTNYLLIEDITGSGISGHTHTGLDDTGWIGLPYLNGWVDYDTSNYGPGGYRKIGKVVYLRGLAKSGNVSLSIAQLPVGFRPGLGKTRVNGQSNELFCQYDIASDGNIIPVTGVNTAWTSLNNISFVADN